MILRKLLGRKDIPDLGSMETTTRVLVIKDQRRCSNQSLIAGMQIFSNQCIPIIQQHITWCQTVWRMLLTCRTDTYTQKNNPLTCQVKGSWPHTNSSVSFATEYGTFTQNWGNCTEKAALLWLSLSKQSHDSRHGSNTCLFLHVDLCWHKEKRARIVKFKLTKGLF